MKISKLSNLIYSLGAAVVIFGAWAKIIHKSYADTMLTVGLLTEAFIFVYMGITDWFKKTETVSSPTTIGNKIQATSENGTDNKELTETLKTTNNILTKIFK